MKTIVVEFELGERVIIKELERMPGRVLAIFLANKGLEYQVRYFQNSEPKEVYFFGEELEKDESR